HCAQREGPARRDGHGVTQIGRRQRAMGGEGRTMPVRASEAYWGRIVTSGSSGDSSTSTRRRPKAARAIALPQALHRRRGRECSSRRDGPPSAGPKVGAPQIAAAEAASPGDGAPEALEDRIGDLTRILQRTVGRLLEVAPSVVRGAREPRHDAARLTLVSAQHGQLHSRFTAKLANPIPGVRFDLPLRTAKRDLDLFDRSRQLLDALLDFGPTFVSTSRSFCTSLGHGFLRLQPRLLAAPISFDTPLRQASPDSKYRH